MGEAVRVQFHAPLRRGDADGGRRLAGGGGGGEACRDLSPRARSQALHGPRGSAARPPGPPPVPLKAPARRTRRRAQHL